MNNYKSFSELKEELGNNYDFKLYEMGISALKEIENLQQENKQLKQKYENAVADYETTMAEKNELKRQNNNFKTSLDESQEVIIDYIKENQELKEQLEEWKELLNKFKAQQKEFIKYMNDTIEDLETEDVDDEEMKGYLIQRIYTFKEILQKYKSIIGVSDDNKTTI